MKSIDAQRIVVFATERAPGSLAKALPPHEGRLIVRSVEPVWLRFGSSEVGYVTRNGNAILFTGGEGVECVPREATHVRVRAECLSTYVQFESWAEDEEIPEPEPDYTWRPNNPPYLPAVPGGAGCAMHTESCFRRSQAVNGVAPAWKHWPVTNLNPSGPGSLRAVMEGEGPRMAVFEVSGVIDLHDLDDDDRDIQVKHGQLYVAGESAPAPGIVVRGVQLLIHVTAKDVVFSHFSNFQYPYTDKNKQNSRGDSISHFVPDGETPTDSNILHSGMCYGHGNDELGDAFRGCHGLTFYQCLFAEALNNTANLEGEEHGFGPIISCEKIASKADFIRCGFLHNKARNPSTSAPLMSIVNCFVFDCWQRGVEISSIDNHATKTNIEGNIFVSGPMGTNDAIFIQDGGAGILNDDSEYFISGNRGLGYDDSSQEDLVSNGPGTMVNARLTEAWAPGLVVTPIEDREAFTRLAARHAGPWPACRQPIIQRFMDHLEARLCGTGEQGGEVLYPEDIYPEDGGMPPLEENTIDHTKGDDPIPGIASNGEQMIGEAAREIQPSGYTAMEEWLDRRRAKIMPSDAVRIEA